MNFKRNKRGFTLVELLAVIVVLAVIMVLAAPAVINSMNSAKKKSFQMYGERMINKAMEAYSSQDLLGGGFNHHYVVGSTTYYCYTLQDLSLGTKTGSYQGFVVVHPSTTVNGTQYTVYLTDDTYVYDGVSSDDVLNHPEKITNTSEGTLAATKSKMAGCK